MLNTALGGIFSSRLNLDLREAHGYTYGAFSGLELHRHSGVLLASGVVQPLRTSEAAAALPGDIARLRDEVLPDEELSGVKERLQQELPAVLETDERATSALAQLAVFGLPADEYARHMASIDAVTAADVKRVARRYLGPDAIRLVIVGDRNKFRASLQAAGVGEPDVRPCGSR